ncbi:cytochrome c [Motiliproteus sp. SC1-56]|uniref:c-type cytochrome n=1 Tax=Motiliproteus sp. SC1-56 TaxID=2799565 RepID=UPI001A8E7868|nr:cytochrome c [Motiliproteus sp. SC1-56]
MKAVNSVAVALGVALSAGFSPLILGSGEHAAGIHQTKTMHDKAKPMHAASPGGSHAHKVWVEPPASYRQVSYDAWQDADAAARGEKIYIEHCATCHGPQGKGKGPIAKALSHPPADLTHHFHHADGRGSAYLFWRVSEGGGVEPFKSRNSAMPAFEQVLSERQRWDVLTYIHQAFHYGFLGHQEMSGHKKTHPGSGH